MFTTMGQMGEEVELMRITKAFKYWEEAIEEYQTFILRNTF